LAGQRGGISNHIRAEPTPTERAYTCPTKGVAHAGHYFIMQIHALAIGKHNHSVLLYVLMFILLLSPKFQKNSRLAYIHDSLINYVMYWELLLTHTLLATDTHANPNLIKYNIRTPGQMAIEKISLVKAELKLP